MIDSPNNSSQSMASFRAIFGRLPNKSTSENYYNWKLRRGGALEGLTHLERRDGADAGSASVTAKQILVHGKVRLAFEIGDTYTHPEHRRKGVFLAAVNKCVEFANSKGATFIYGTPNDASLSGYVAKAEFIEIRDLRVAILTKRITKESLVKAFRRYVRLLFLAKMAGSIVWCARGVVRKIRMMGRAAAQEIQFDQFPAGDGAWGNREEYLFWMRRDSEYIKWRFVENPDSYRIWVVRRNDKVAGYAVAKFYSRDESRVCAICDIVAIDDAIHDIVSLIDGLEEAASREGVEYCETWCSSRSPYFNAIVNAGYREIAAFPVIINAGSPVASMLTGPGNWHFTLSDSDNI